MRLLIHPLCGVLAEYLRKVPRYDWMTFPIDSIPVLPSAVYSPDRRSVGQIPWENWHTSETIHTFSLVLSHLLLHS